MKFENLFKEIFVIKFSQVNNKNINQLYIIDMLFVFGISFSKQKKM